MVPRNRKRSDHHHRAGPDTGNPGLPGYTPCSAGRSTSAGRSGVRRAQETLPRPGRPEGRWVSAAPGSHQCTSRPHVGADPIDEASRLLLLDPHRAEGLKYIAPPARLTRLACGATDTASRPVLERGRRSVGDLHRKHDDLVVLALEQDPKRRPGDGTRPASSDGREEVLRIIGCWDRLLRQAAEASGEFGGGRASRRRKSPRGSEVAARQTKRQRHGSGSSPCPSR